MIALEQAGLDQLHERLGAEHADGEVHAVEDEREDGQAGQRLADKPPQAFLDARRRPAAVTPVLDGQVVRHAGVVAAVGRIERGHGRAADRLAQFRDAAALGGHRLDHGNAQPRRQPGGVDHDAVHPRLVGHVQHEHHRPADRGELGGQHQPAPEVSGVRHLDDDVRVAGVEDAPRDELVFGERPFERRDAGRVDEFAHLAARHHPALRQRHGGPGVIRDDGVLAGQASEQDALADVGVADKRDAARAGAKGQDRGGGGSRTAAWAQDIRGLAGRRTMTEARHGRCHNEIRSQQSLS